MVRRAEIRKRRFEASLDPEKIARNLAALKPSMVEQESVYLAEISLLERKIKALCEAQAVTSYQIAQYINVGRQCYSLSKRFSSLSRDAEAQAVVDHWIARGLDPILTRDSCRLTGCNPTAAPGPSPEVGFLPTQYELAVGRYYESLLMGSWDQFSQDYGRDFVLASPYPVIRRSRWDRIAFGVQAPWPGAEVRIGLYDSTGNAYPNRLLVDSGPVDCSEGGEKTTSIDLTLEKGLYFVAFIASDSHVSPVVYERGSLPCIGESYSGSPEAMRSYVIEQPYGPLPDPYPVGAGEDTGMALIRLRLAQFL